jgi:hypothetical protein
MIRPPQRLKGPKYSAPVMARHRHMDASRLVTQSQAGMNFSATPFMQ